MSTVVKNEGKMTEAWELGAGSAKEQEMIEKGLIVVHEGGENGKYYELLSQESVNGSGEIAHEGDFFKVDGSGAPYPNEREWFEANHTHIEGDTYEQHPTPLEAYNLDKDGENVPEAVRFLVDNGLLVIDEDDPEHHYNANLWGTDESAAKDATVIIYGVARDENGNITDVDFNFVAKDEFDATYHYVELPDQNIESGAGDKAEIRQGFENGLVGLGEEEIKAIMNAAETWTEENVPATNDTEGGTEAGAEDPANDVEKSQNNNAFNDDESDPVGVD